MAITISYPKVKNDLLAKHNAYVKAMNDDSAMSVIEGKKKDFTEALRAHNQAMSVAAYDAFLATEKPLFTALSEGYVKQVASKRDKDSKAIELVTADSIISLKGFLAHAKEKKVDIGVKADAVAKFYSLRYALNARVTKDLGLDTSNFKTAFGIVPANFVGDRGRVKDVTSTTQLVKLLSEFMDALGVEGKVNNYDVNAVLYAMTTLDRGTLNKFIMASEGTMWRIMVDVSRKVLGIADYSAEYKDGKKAKAEAPKGKKGKKAAA